MSEMRPDTWMPFYVADYFRDTRHLSTTEHGAYLLMLFHAWTHNGKLPTSVEQLLRITGLSKRQWKESSETLIAFFSEEFGYLTHSRINYELRRAQGISEKRKAAGKASAAARNVQHMSNKCSTNVKAYVQHMGEQNGRQPQLQSHTPIDKPIGVGAKRASRLVQNFKMPDDWITWAEAEKGWDRQTVIIERDSFIDFWHAKPGKDGTKLDWLATWRNWCRNSRRNSGNGTPELEYLTPC